MAALKQSKFFKTYFNRCIIIRKDMWFVTDSWHGKRIDTALFLSQGIQTVCTVGQRTLVTKQNPSCVVSLLCFSILIAFSLNCMIIHVFDMRGLFMLSSIILSHVLGVPEVVSLICQHSMYLWINIDVQPLCEWSSSYAEAKNYPFGYGNADLIPRPALAHTL